jgi:5-oxoprolinase (ATP-hydrolysing)
VTDANLYLGYLPSELLGGSFKLDVVAAATAVESIAKQMGMDAQQAAEGIIDLVNEAMNGALRLVSVEQGFDPRDFALCVFGGAGPLHGNALGKLLNSWPVIVPPSPGILCAQGDATTKMSVEQSCTYIKLWSDIKVEQLCESLDELKQSCLKTVTEALNDAEALFKTLYSSDMRYKGQAMTLVSPTRTNNIGWNV